MSIHFVFSTPIAKLYNLANNNGFSTDFNVQKNKPLSTPP